jgi:hypothetical protein
MSWKGRKKPKSKDETENKTEEEYKEGKAIPITGRGGP